MMGFDFDMFDFWDDLQYGNEEYWDYGGLGVPTGSTRKRAAVAQQKNKRRKLELKETDGGNVRFVSIFSRTHPVRQRAVKLDSRTRVESWR